MDFHNDKLKYFGMQTTVTVEDVIPFLTKNGFNCIESRVLEIGCAEAGVLKGFIDNGAIGVGVELSESRVKDANKFMAEYAADGRFSIYNINIFDINSPDEFFGELFDLVVLKDVIEHIPNQEAFIVKLKEFLKPEGKIFFAYPPWYMPFGGHQQVCNNKILRILPWFHLLPKPLYKSILKLGKVPPEGLNELMELVDTGITIDRQYKILRTHNFKIIDEIYWFLNPIYQWKFNFKKRKVASLFTKIPYLRNFYTTAHYLLFKPL